MFYTLGAELVRTAERPFDQWQDLIIILSSKELGDALLPLGLLPERTPGMQAIRYCKADVEDDYLAGTLARPRQRKEMPRAAFAYALWRGNLLFVDDSGYCLKAVERLSRHQSRLPWTAGRVFVEILEDLITNDLELLNELEDEAARIERSVLEEASFENIDQQLIAFRKEVSAFANYYLQLADLAVKLQEDTEDYFSEDEERRLKIFGERVGRLREEALMLREYAMQIREVYQAQIGIRQNEIMKFLTVVTSIFLPLSLIAGWYGMNFAHMPELHWVWGYPAVIGLSLAIAAGCIIYFKRRKFW